MRIRSTKFRPVPATLAVLAALLLLATAATLVLAAETSLLDGKLRAGDTVTVPTDETVDGDLYLFAGTVTMDGTVDGDLAAFGGQVQVNGSVTGDLLVAGGTVNVNGDVSGDIRSSGGQVTISGTTGEDLVATGGQTTLSSGGTVGGDLIVSGGTVSVAGEVAGNIEGSAGTYTRSGTVGGDEHVVVPTEEDDVAEATTNRVTDGLRHFVVLLIIGGILLWLLPRLVRRPADALASQPLLALGGGLLAWIGFVVGIIALVLIAILLAIALGLLQLGALVAVEIVGTVLAIGVLSFLFWVAVAFLADIVVAFALARLVARDDPSWTTPWRELLLLAAGVALVVIVTSLPIVGGFAKLLVVLFGLGALAVAAWRWWRGRGRPTPPPAQEAPAV
jgi:cytoskeletal protein CcmA (bactofilin family)